MKQNITKVKSNSNDACSPIQPSGKTPQLSTSSSATDQYTSFWRSRFGARDQLSQKMREKVIIELQIFSNIQHMLIFNENLLNGGGLWHTVSPQMSRKCPYVKKNCFGRPQAILETAFTPTQLQTFPQYHFYHSCHSIVTCKQQPRDNL